MNAISQAASIGLLALSITRFPGPWLVNVVGALIFARSTVEALQVLLGTWLGVSFVIYVRLRVERKGKR